MDAIILLAGKGTRLNAPINKVLLDLNGKPVFKYSLDLLKKLVDNIILVISPQDEALIAPYLDESIKIAYGGPERYLSVYNGVLASNSNKVLIHDGARPNVNLEKLQELLSYSNDYDALMLAYEEKNTIYELNGEKLIPLERNKIVLAATPQIVDRGLYLKAVEKAKKDLFRPTDDISLLLNLDPNLKVKYVMDEGNLKITNPIDLSLAKMVVKND